MKIPGGAQPPFKIFIAVSGDKLQKEAFGFAVKLRTSEVNDPMRFGLAIGDKNICVEGPFNGKSLKSQLKLADRFGADITIIFGEEEYARGAIAVRDMKTQQQHEIKL